MRGSAGALRRAARRLGRRLAGHGADVVHSPECCVALPGALHDPWRTARIREFLDREGLLDHGRLHPAPEPRLEDLRRVHTLDYLEALERPGGTQRAFGERLGDALEQQLLVAQRRMAGGTALAARLALDRRGVAVHLGGGLHHAHAARGAGFCLINDVAVAIARLRRFGFGGRTVVVDLDLHDGDGTRALFAEDESVHTYSIHNRAWDERAAVESTSIALGSGVEDAAYLASLRESLPALLDRFRPELAIYLAGVDPAHDDALGDWRISDAGLVERDRFVLAELGRRHVPVAVVLAGGYGDHAWRHSARSFSALLGDGRPIEPPSTAELLVERFRGIAGSLAPTALAGYGDELLTAEDLLEAFGGEAAGPRRFLGFYTPAGLELALERLGYLEELRRLGFEHPQFEFDLGAPGGDTLRVFGGPDRSELLVELRVRRERRALPGFELLWVEWLLLQNPRARFSEQRPALPGQQHPGLGMLRETMAALVLVCDRLSLDGIGVTASRFHPAAQSAEVLLPLDPADAPVFRALLAAVEGLPMARAADLVEHGGLVDAATGAAFHWRPFSLVFPTSERAKRHFAGDTYRRVADAPAPRFRIRSD
jgi:acetoin utilization deacetylase AcuC-like enzyme